MEEAQIVAHDIEQYGKQIVQEFFELKGPSQSMEEARERERNRSTMEEVAVVKAWMAMLKRDDISTELRDLGDKYLTSASVNRCEAAQRVADEIVQNSKEQVQKMYDSKPRSAGELEVLEELRSTQEELVVLRNWMALLESDGISHELRDMGNKYMALESTVNLRSELPRSAGGTMKWLNSKQTKEWLRNYDRDRS